MESPAVYEASYLDVRDSDRLTADLEFIQLLSNPQYLQYLAHNNYLFEKEFLNYLRYLEYWRKPEYAKYLLFPSCLDMLYAINSSQTFRESLRSNLFIELLHQSQGGNWMKGPSFVDEISEKKMNNDNEMIVDAQV